MGDVGCKKDEQTSIELDLATLARASASNSVENSVGV